MSSTIARATGCPMVPRATAASTSIVAEEFKIEIHGIEYVLVPTDPFVSFDSHASSPVLVLTFPTQPGDVVSQDQLRSFRTDKLEKDDVFQPSFSTNLIFYGSNEDEVDLQPDAAHELESWDVTNWSFVKGNPAHSVAPGPYVFVNSRVWQPWRVYRDFNATFMCTFKPSPRDPGG